MDGPSKVVIKHGDLDEGHMLEYKDWSYKLQVHDLGQNMRPLLEKLLINRSTSKIFVSFKGINEIFLI